MSIKNISKSALMISLYCILSMLGISAGAVKISFALLPVIIGASKLGWKYGTLIGFIGCFIMQIIRYSWCTTTLLWCIPPCLLGLIIGVLGNKELPMLFGMLSVTLSNTLVYFIDSKIYGYYNYELIFGTLLIRIFWCVCTTILYWYIVPKIMECVEEK